MELKNELEAKHSREMEELRTYFEKKCADVEKKYVNIYTNGSSYLPVEDSEFTIEHNKLHTSRLRVFQFFGMSQICIIE